MKKIGSRYGAEGFSLMLVIVIFVAVGMGAASAVIFSAKIKKISTEHKTIKQMLVIRGAARNYFRGQEALAGTAGSEQDVPIGAQFLNLRQDYRQDAWGQTLVYYVPPAGAGQISGVTVNGKAVAGYILSFGQNQTRESAPAGPAINQAGDDILVPINVQTEAIEITRKELEVLVKKVWAYGCGEHLMWTGHEIDRILSYFSLADPGYRRDSWQRDYRWNGKEFYSFGPDGLDNSGSADDIILPARTSTCPNGTTPPAPLLFLSLEEGTGNTVSGQVSGVIDGGAGNEGGTGASWQEIGTEVGQIDGPPGSASSWCLYFDGINDFVEMEQPAYFNITEDFTLAAWIQTTGTLNAYAKVICRRQNATNYYFLGSKGTGGTQNCSTADAHPYSGVLNGSTPHFTTTRDVIDMPCGEWHHVAAVFDYDPAGSSLSIYYDGVLKDTQNRVVAPPDDSNIVLYIGAYAGGNTHFFQGYLNEIYIFDKALTESQIRDLAYLP